MSDTAASRREIFFETTLAPDAAETYDLYAELTAPEDASTLLITLHGVGFSHEYWDFPLDNEKHSFVEAAAEAGIATLNLDRLGVGRSDRPPAEELTLQAEAFVAHQLVQQAKGEGIEGRVFDKVVIVGHSLGSGISIVEANTYGDADGVVLTGFLHEFGPLYDDFEAALVPVSTQPDLADLDAPEGYLAPALGTGGTFFYEPSTNPRIAAQAEATRQTATPAELATFAPVVADPAASSAISAPVLSLTGAFDGLFADFGAQEEAVAERAFFPGSAAHQTVVVPETGHAIQLEERAGYATDVLLDWVARVAGGDPAAAATAVGGPDDDVVAGDDGANLVRGRAGDDLLDAGGGDDRVSGGRGDDTLVGGGGADELRGGPGDDAFVLRPSDFADGLQPGGRHDRIRGFEGAGDGAESGDVLRLEGFGAGAKLAFLGDLDGCPDAHLYAVRDGAGLDVATVVVTYVGDARLAVGDYAFA